MKTEENYSTSKHHHSDTRNINNTKMLDLNRIWVDGCFDFTHHGHCGALLQARRTAEDPTKSQLFVGIHTDEQVIINKGPPVMNTQERYGHARAIRWCSEVVEDAPYVTDPKWLDEYNCQFVVHGDDITTDANGEDCYQEMKDIGRFKVVKRTYGVSTTDIIQRILTGENNHLEHRQKGMYNPTKDELIFYSHGEDGVAMHCTVWNNTFDDVVVQGNTLSEKNTILILGHFDLFHMGHIEQLANIHKVYPNDKIIIGLLDSENNDDCIMTLKERALSILSCRYVDGLILTPGQASISTSTLKCIIDLDNSTKYISGSGSFSAYLTKQVIVDRINKQRDLYVARNKSKGMVLGC